MDKNEFRSSYLPSNYFWNLAISSYKFLTSNPAITNCQICFIGHDTLAKTERV